MIDGRAQFLQVRHAACEHRIPDHGAKFGEERRRFVADHVPPIDLIGIGERHEQPDREAALIVLEQIDIARADAQDRCHLCLGLMALAPQLAKLRADERLGQKLPPGIYNTTKSATMYADLQHIDTILNAESPTPPLTARKTGVWLQTGSADTEALMAQRILILGASYGSWF